MKNCLEAFVVCIALGVARFGVCNPVEPPAPPAADESITITVSTEGLGKYTEEFSTTVLRLERLLEEIRQAELALPTEDIERLDELVVSSTALIETIGKNAEQFSTVIQDAQAPVLDLSSKVLDQAERRVVAPLIEGVDNAAGRVGKTATFAIVALSMLVLLILTFVSVGAYLLNLRAKSLFTGMGKIIDGHVVVPRDTWQAATASLAAKEPPIHAPDSHGDAKL